MLFGLAAFSLIAFVLHALVKFIRKPSLRSAKSSSRNRTAAMMLFILSIVVAFAVKHHNLDKRAYDYVRYLKQSISASKADDGILSVGYRHYVDSFQAKSGAHEIVGGWTRVPHVVSVLSASEASDIASKVLSRRSDFFHIDHLAYALPFFTLGPYWGYHHYSEDHNHNTKLERPQGGGLLSSTFSTYGSAVSSTRSSLLSDFPLLYDRVLSALKSSLGASSVSFLPGGGAGVPGFHVIESHVAWSYPLFRFHVDEGFHLLMAQVVEGYASANAKIEAGDGAPHSSSNPSIVKSACDERSRISFTLALSLPSPTSGLDYIDFSPSLDPRVCGSVSPSSKFACHERKRQVYEVGKMVVHSGMMVHSIGNWNFTDPDKPRITMQGFGFKCFENDWFVYW